MKYRGKNRPLAVSRGQREVLGVVNGKLKYERDATRTKVECGQ